MTRRGRVLLLKSATWLACLTPIAWVAYRFYLGDGLGANPIEELEHWSGLTALITLLAALAVTPARRLTGWNDLQKLRRLVGLFAFFYATLHLTMYIVLDYFFAWGLIWENIVERPYITVGMLAWLLLLPLALTSTKGWIRRMGKNWVRLHRLVYVAAPLGVLHFAWKEKADLREPLILAAILGVLFAVRLWYRARKQGRGGTRSRAGGGSTATGSA